MNQVSQTIVPAAPGFNTLSVWLEPRNVPATHETIEQRLEVDPVVAWRIQNRHVSALTPWWESPDGLAHQDQFADAPGTVWIRGLEHPDGRVFVDLSGPFPNRAAFVQYAVESLRLRQQQYAKAA